MEYRAQSKYWSWELKRAVHPPRFILQALLRLRLHRAFQTLQTNTSSWNLVLYIESLRMETLCPLCTVWEIKHQAWSSSSYTELRTQRNFFWRTSESIVFLAPLPPCGTLLVLRLSARSYGGEWSGYQTLLLILCIRAVGEGHWGA